MVRPVHAEHTRSDAVERLRHDLEAFASLSEPGVGVTRLAFTTLERQAHARFHERMASLGIPVRTDAAGNSIAELPATSPGAGSGAVGTGSHLDSVPHGGAYDGVAGVVAAMEVARRAVEERIPRRRPWRFVAFAGEEGARFGQSCNGSRAVAGLTSAAACADLHDVGGETLAHAMGAVGLPVEDLASARWAPADWHAFVELHIEQGTVLEREDIPIGIVERISGSSRLEVVVDGIASHSGGTPMAGRRDALVTAAQCVLECRSIATDRDHDETRVTVGRLVVEPDSITTIPGRVVFTVDVRDVDAARQHATASALAIAFERIARRDGTTMSITHIGDTDPVMLGQAVPDSIAAAARECGVPSLRMHSGASHDTQQVSTITSAGMVFVPSRRGLSHVPEEFTAPEHLGIGVDVLYSAMRKLDAS